MVAGMKDDTITHARALQAMLQAELIPGEQLVWTGKPDARRLHRIFAIWAFAIPWTVFACAWTALALQPWFGGLPESVSNWSLGAAFPVVGIPFILIGLWMLAQPFVARHRAGRTLYALTDSRLIRLVTGSRRRAEFLRRDSMGPVTLELDKDGWGSVTVVTGTQVGGDGDRIIDRLELDAVPQAEALYREIALPHAA
jgi:hypothetical protein